MTEIELIDIMWRSHILEQENIFTVLCLFLCIFNFLFEELNAQNLSQKQYSLCDLPRIVFRVILILEEKHEHKQQKLISARYGANAITKSIYLLRLEATSSKV